MGTEELQRAAQRRRDREAQEAAARATEAKQRATDRSAGARRMKRVRVDEALAEAGWTGKLFTGTALCVGLFGPMAVGIFVMDSEAILPILGISVACMIGAFVMANASERFLAAIRRRRLDRVGRGFDPRGYLEALSANRRHATLVVRVRFARPWPDDARASAPDAVLEWMPSLLRPTWDGDTLVLRRESIECTEWLSGGDVSSGGRYFNNRKLHGCFLDVIGDVVPRLEEVVPIAKLDVAIEGSIEAWDADA